MAHRSNESAMDFEYDNKTGPVDQNSPFMRPQQQRQQQTNSLAKKRPHSVLDSPSKSAKSATFPNLRNPTSNSTFYFSPPSLSSKPLPSPPASKNPAFNTPRKFEPPQYDSSEVDLSSPEYNADSDATPDNKMGFTSSLIKARRTIAQTLTPEKKKDPALVRLTAASGKGEIAKVPYSHRLEHKINKKRSKDKNWFLKKRGGSNEDSDGESKDRDTKTAPARPGLIASTFGFINTHPDLPHILSFYAQLLLNVFLVFFIIYLIYSFWATIRADVDKKSEEAIVEIMADMAVCAQSYQNNGCDGDKRAPALENLCENWERCMNRDPKKIGRARVSAHTFAEIFNGFIEPISWKAMIFTFILIFGCVGISNFAFSFFRNKANAYPPPPPPTPQYMPTPHRNGPADYNSWAAAYQSPAAGYGNREQGMMDNGSPMRRLQY